MKDETPLSDEYFISTLYVKGLFKDRDEYERKCIYIDQSSFCEKCAKELSDYYNEKIKKKFRYRLAKAKNEYGPCDFGFLTVPKVAYDDCATQEKGPLECYKCGVPLVTYLDRWVIEQELKDCGVDDEKQVEDVVNQYESITNGGTIETMGQYYDAVELFRKHHLWEQA